MDENNVPSMDRIVAEVRDWLGVEGRNFFRDVKSKYGTLIACWDEGGMPHPIHFREGMQVRNHLRLLTSNSWTADEYDNLWVGIVEKAIEE